MAEGGEVLGDLRAGQTSHLLISVRFKEAIHSPIIGFTVRDRLGVEITSSNTSYEQRPLPDAAAGDIFTVGFELRIPELRPGSYSISPAVAQGTIWEHTIEDWVDNAYIFDLLDTGLVYGQMRWPVTVRFSRIRE
ncbi:MAG: Wzt carbohydrate-binding domain-containing protein, partial [Opitutales bacterium]